jgi:hypothetical protein
MAPHQSAIKGHAAGKVQTSAMSHLSRDVGRHLRVGANLTDLGIPNGLRVFKKALGIANQVLIGGYTAICLSS